MKNPAYLVSLDDGEEEEIHPLDLAPLGSNSAPNVTVPAEAEDASKDEIIPALESDHSTEDEGGIEASGTSGKVALDQLEDGDGQLDVNGNFRKEDSLQPPEDPGPLNRAS